MRGRTIEVLYTDLLFKLPLILTIEEQVSGIGYEICGFAAKDLSKINEGEVKERVHALVGCLFRQLLLHK
jgi:hypothetical protein